jgi:HK97 family phage prohead protease
MGDVIQAGAFKNTLADWRDNRGKFPPMLLQHGGTSLFGGNAEDLLPVGQWTDMEENARGLKVTGRLFALETEKGQYIYEGLKTGVLDGLSIGFRTKQKIDGTKPGEPRRTVTEIDLWEVSIVTFPSNPRARIASVKSITSEQWRELEASLEDARLSRSDRRMAIGAFKRWLQCEAGEDAVPAQCEAETDAEVLKAAEGLMASFLRDAFAR